MPWAAASASPASTRTSMRWGSTASSVGQGLATRTPEVWPKSIQCRRQALPRSRSASSSRWGTTQVIAQSRREDREGIGSETDHRNPEGVERFERRREIENHLGARGHHEYRLARQSAFKSAEMSGRFDQPRWTPPMPPVAKTRIGVGEGQPTGAHGGRDGRAGGSAPSGERAEVTVACLGRRLHRGRGHFEFAGIEADPQRAVDHRDHGGSGPGVSDGLIQELDRLEIQRRVLVPCWRATDQFGDPTVCPQAARCWLAVAGKPVGEHRGLERRRRVAPRLEASATSGVGPDEVGVGHAHRLRVRTLPMHSSCGHLGRHDAAGERRVVLGLDSAVLRFASSSSLDPARVSRRVRSRP